MTTASLVDYYRDAAEYRNPLTGERPNMREVRRWIATHPLGADDYGKGFVTPLGHRIGWQTVPMYGESDGWPAHVDGIRALGYLVQGYDEYWRDELSTFRHTPQAGQQDYDPENYTYGEGTYTY